MRARPVSRTPLLSSFGLPSEGDGDARLCGADGRLRVWDVVRTRDEFLLRSRVQGKLWAPKAEAVAQCYQTALEHQPNARCVCGIHAAKSAKQAVPYLSRRFKREDLAIHRVIGRVSLWGTVVVGSRGLCGPLTYPRDIYVPAPRGWLLPRLSSLSPPVHPAKAIVASLRSYGVPVAPVPYADLRDITTVLRQIELREMLSAAVMLHEGRPS